MCTAAAYGVSSKPGSTGTRPARSGRAQARTAKPPRWRGSSSRATAARAARYSPGATSARCPSSARRSPRPRSGEEPSLCRAADLLQTRFRCCPFESAQVHVGGDVGLADRAEGIVIDPVATVGEEGAGQAPRTVKLGGLVPIVDDQQHASRRELAGDRRHPPRRLQADLRALACPELHAAGDEIGAEIGGGGFGGDLREAAVLPADVELAQLAVLAHSVDRQGIEELVGQHQIGRALAPVAAFGQVGARPPRPRGRGRPAHRRAASPGRHRTRARGTGWTSRLRPRRRPAGPGSARRTGAARAHVRKSPSRVGRASLVA